MRHHRTAAALVALAASSAGAQPVDSFRELAELVGAGRSIAVVTAPADDVIIGSVLDISPGSLSVLDADGRRIRLDEARVRRVQQLWDDPILDGMALGFAVGAAPAMLLAFVGTGSEDPDLSLPVVSAVFGGVIGAVLDVSRSERLQDLYRSRRQRVAISPLQGGAALSISW